MPRVFEVLVEMLAVVFGDGGGEFTDRKVVIGGNDQPRTPTDDDAGKWARNLEAIPGAEGPAALGVEVKTANGRAGEPGKLDGAGFGAVDGATGSVGGEDGGATGVENLLEAEQGLRAAARAGATHGRVAEKLKDAGDEFPVEALADDDGGAGGTVVIGAGEDALMPEAENVPTRGKAVESRGDAFVGDDLKSPGATEGVKQEPDERRHDGQQNSLTEGEWAGRTPGHRLDCTRGGIGLVVRCVSDRVSGQL